MRCRDSLDKEHRIEVIAQSVKEAAAQALREFRDIDWCDERDRDPATVVVNVAQPVIKYRVRIRDFEG